MKRYIRNVNNEVKHTPSLPDYKIARYKLKQMKKAAKKRKLRKVKTRGKVNNRLEDNLPASERWFRELYLKETINRLFSEDLFKDQFNKPFNKTCIPIVCNIGYKYIIEVDGSIHNNPEQKLKDIKKDYYFNKRGYLVIRVKYGDNASYKDCIEKIKARVSEIDAIELERRKQHVYNNTRL